MAYLRQIHLKVHDALYFHFGIETISSKINRSVHLIIIVILNYFIVKPVDKIFSLDA